MYLEQWFADIAPLIDDKKMKVKIAALECLGKIVKNNNSKDCYKKLQKFMTPGGCEMIRQEIQKMENPYAFQANFMMHYT